MLRKNGLKTVQGPSKVSPELSGYLNRIIGECQKDFEIENLLSENRGVQIANLLSQFKRKFRL